MDETTITGALRSLGLRYAVAELTPSEAASSTHLAIGPTGIWLIDDVKAGGGPVSGDQAQDQRYVYRDGALWSGDHSLTDAIHAIEQRAGDVGEVLGHPVRPVICLPKAHLPRPAQLIDRVRLVEHPALNALILEAVRQFGNDEIADTVRACAELPLTQPVEWSPPPAPMRPLRRNAASFGGGGVRFTLYALTGILLLIVIVAAVSITALSSSKLTALRTIPATVSCGPSGWEVSFSWPEIKGLDRYHLTVEENGQTVDLGTWTGPETVHTRIFRNPGATLHLTAMATVRGRPDPLKVTSTLEVPPTPC